MNFTAPAQQQQANDFEFEFKADQLDLIFLLLSSFDVQKQQQPQHFISNSPVIWHHFYAKVKTKHKKKKHQSN